MVFQDIHLLNVFVSAVDQDRFFTIASTIGQRLRTYWL